MNNQPETGLQNKLTPLVTLKTNKTNPVFEPFQPVHIHLKAICRNMNEEDILLYRWIYCDSSNFVKSYTSWKSGVLLTCPNHFCGRMIEVRVEVLFKNSSSEKVEASIRLNPSCKKKIADKVDWFTENPDPDAGIQAYLNASGYNGKELGVRRYILYQGNSVWEDYYTLTVTDNNLGIDFSKRHCDTSLTTDKEYTFFFQVVNPDNGNLLTSSSQNVTISARAFLPAIPSASLQPVVVGITEIVENNFHPCKYTGIHLVATNKDGDTVSRLLFDESRSIKVSPVHIIGGTNDFEVELINYEVKKCDTKGKPHKKNLAQLKYYNSSENKELSIGSDKKVRFLLKYDYGLSATAGLAVAPLTLAGLLFKYFWPSREGVAQTTCLHLDTCRHNKVLPILIYPDVTFEFGFVSNYTGGEEYLKSHGVVVDKFEPFALPVESDGITADFGFSLAFSAEFADNRKVELEAEVTERIKNVFKLMALLKPIIAKIFGFKDNMLGGEEIDIPTKVPAEKPLDYSPVKGFVKTPSVALGIKWKAAYDDNEEVGTEIALYAKFSPLLSAGIYFDIIGFVGRYGGPWGAVVTGLRAFLDIALNTQINLYIQVTGNTEIKGEVPLRKLKTSEETTLVEGEASLEIQAGLEVDVNGKFVIMEVIFRAELYGKGGIFAKIELGSDEEGLYYRNSLGNTSVEVTGAIKGEAHFKGIVWDNDSGKEEDKKTTNTTGSEITFTLLDKKEYWRGEKNRI